MPSITLEYMIMIPVLIAQIFIFPFTASVIMNTWTDSRMTIELQEIAGHVGSSIQQLYYTINHESTSSGSMSITLDMPALIEGHSYTTTLTHVTQLDTSYKIMNVTLKLQSTKDQTSTLVTLGQNVDWQDNLSFRSGAQPIIVVAEKASNSIVLSLGGS
jgi:hypothetical protein